MQPRIPYQIDVFEVNGLTLIFSPVALDIEVTNRAEFDEAYEADLHHSQMWTDEDILAQWLEPFTSNGDLQYFYNVAEENLQLEWLTSADAIYHERFEVMYVNESYAIRGILANLVRPENWEDALFPDRFTEYSLPGFGVESPWLDSDLRHAAHDFVLGNISKSAYEAVFASVFAGEQ